MIGTHMPTVNFGRVLGLGVALALVIAVVPASEAMAATAPAKLSLTASSHDGAAFDFDEYVDGDITVQVTNAAKKAVDIHDARDLKYFWTVKPFGTPAAPIRVPAAGSSTPPVDVLGKFVVPLPQGRPSGTYTLTVGFAAGKSGTVAVTGTTLALKVGKASIAFADPSPLRTDAGTTSTLKGDLKLEDGTGLPGRVIDLGITHGAAGSDPEADAGFQQTSDDSPQGSVRVTTGSTGAFTALLDDPSEPGQGTELGDVIDADTATTPHVGNADATQVSLAVDFVWNLTPPAGTTAVLAPISGGTPGQSFAGSLTITAPDDTFDTDATTPGVQGDMDGDRDPVQGEVYTISLDHGFFTTGQSAQPPVVGAMAGDLDQLGTTMTGITGPDGKIDFNVGMGRDTGFDDDGKVTATVTALVGGDTHTQSAVWDSTNPLNGQVKVVLSSKSQQDNPVNPTVAGNRAYYDVLALDQFGNRAGKDLIDLTYTGDTDNWDYSDDSTVSDFTAGSDIWLTSFEPATIIATGSWEDAPTDLYIDTAGNSEPGTATASDSTSSSFYEVDFDTSTFSMTSSATDVVKLGTVVTQTVRVVDQLGNPVPGYDVQFYRYGPNAVSADVQADETTNAKGEATYRFIGTKLGTATVTAEVTDGIGTQELIGTVRFGSVITAHISADADGKYGDHLTVSASSVASGARVELYRVVSGTQVLASVGTLGRSGKVAFIVTDLNGRAGTSYVALVRSTSKTVAAYSPTITIR